MESLRPVTEGAVDSEEEVVEEVTEEDETVEEGVEEDETGDALSSQPTKRKKERKAMAQRRPFCFFMMIYLLFNYIGKERK
jgi:hypothetical protein